MSGHDPLSSVRLTDPRALRAYAHPTRMALVGLLRREGSLTATQAADSLGESVASCSFHLRQLAKYGLVEEAGGGRGREKPWRATAMFTSWDSHPADPQAAAAAQGFQLAMAEQYYELSARWVQASPREPADWQEAAWFGDYQLRLTAAELDDLNNRIQDLVRPYLDGPGQDRRQAPDARPVALLHLAFPTDASDASDTADAADGTDSAEVTATATAAADRPAGTHPQGTQDEGGASSADDTTDAGS